MSDWTKKLSRGAQRTTPAGSAASRPPVLSGPLELHALDLLDRNSAQADLDRAFAAFELLAKTPSGRADLESLITNSVTILFHTRRGGTGYDPSAQTITLSRTQVPSRTALDLAHHALHVRIQAAGNHANIDLQSQDAYVGAILAATAYAYLHEAEVGRELMHLGDAAAVKQVMTVHPVQMWMQLVHGVPYHQPPSSRVLSADAALTAAQLQTVVDSIAPHFMGYVEFYRAVEMAKWEIRHGLRKPEKPEVVADVIAMCREDQAKELTFPMR